MTTPRTTPARRTARFARRAALALAAGTGIALAPMPAQAAPLAQATAPSAELPWAPTHQAQVAVQTALAQQGDPYVWGGGGPNSFDCSGLTQFAYGTAGVGLPHSSRIQGTIGRDVAKRDLLPGDLVFFYSPIGHVGMYIGNGQMVHSPSAGKSVHITSVDSVPGFNHARRIVG
ncbi:C40 family peptidase [Geodermatophilus sp. YIM 151500]|uniref:C40 family peptidase n=1 Tax=Geodermatophilus sp. YIM 151500 TaxID=2984531 RepID=UPI0021E41670|nr:C40 family peptidase [Geodermatophilus sp. YIM 151500]MCV2488210.1 C40 family peptidase [Geodermatophilus sp. YIM 151500]